MKLIEVRRKIVGGCYGGLHNQNRVLGLILAELRMKHARSSRYTLNPKGGML